MRSHGPAAWHCGSRRLPGCRGHTPPVPPPPTDRVARTERVGHPVSVHAPASRAPKERGVPGAGAQGVGCRGAAGRSAASTGATSVASDASWAGDNGCRPTCNSGTIPPRPPAKTGKPGMPVWDGGRAKAGLKPEWPPRELRQRMPESARQDHGRRPPPTQPGTTGSLAPARRLVGDVGLPGETGQWIWNDIGETRRALETPDTAQRETEALAAALRSLQALVDGLTNRPMKGGQPWPMKADTSYRKEAERRT